jgi:hypothetical protein
VFITSVNVFNNGFQNHCVDVYASRLFTKIPNPLPDDLDFENPDFIRDGTVETFRPNNLGGDMPNSLVTMYYNLDASGAQKPECGVTEEFVCTQSPSNIRDTVIPNYLNVRMALACQNFHFQYARISAIPNTRIVDFVTRQNVNGAIDGLYASSDAIGKDTWVTGQSNALLLRMKITNGPSAKIFLHGFPAAVIRAGKYLPNAAGGYDVNAQKFIAFFKDNTNGVQHMYFGGNTLANRKLITSITRGPFRGYVATPNTAFPGGLPAGAFVYVGGGGAGMKGLTGRKRVLIQDTTGTTVSLGGATPIGDYVTNSAYIVALTQSFNFIDYGSIERPTSRKVGPPFAQPHGRAKTALSLRR